MDSEEFTALMKELPLNVIQCLSLTGYDSLEVIAQMTTDGPGYSIDVIDNYILQEHSNDPSCFHLSNIKYTHIFTPGHRIRLSNFIQTVKSQCLKRKLPLPNTSNKQKPNSNLDKASNYAAAGVSANPTNNLKQIYEDIRKHSFNWVKTSVHMPRLKEHDDYTIKVKLNELNHPVATINCALCGKPYKLNEKPNSSDGMPMFMLSHFNIGVRIKGVAINMVVFLNFLAVMFQNHQRKVHYLLSVRNLSLQL